MTYNDTPVSGDVDDFYMTYSQPVRTIEKPIKLLPYRITTFADILSTRSTDRCIGKKGYGSLADRCRTALSHDIYSTSNVSPKNTTTSINGWAKAEKLVELARLYLCQECCRTQLSDVVVAWVKELEYPDEATVRGADSVIDDDDMNVESKSKHVAPAKTLVAASFATRGLVTKAWGLLW